MKVEKRGVTCIVDMKVKGVRYDKEDDEKLGKRLKKAKTNIIDYSKRRTGVKIERREEETMKKRVEK